MMEIICIKFESTWVMLSSQILLDLPANCYYLLQTIAIISITSSGYS
jgi:hypothetical protein